MICFTSVALILIAVVAGAIAMALVGLLLLSGPAGTVIGFVLIALITTLIGWALSGALMALVEAMAARMGKGKT